MKIKSGIILGLSVIAILGSVNSLVSATAVPPLPMERVRAARLPVTAFGDSLHGAVRSHNFGRVTELLRAGANPNTFNSYGETPLAIAVDGIRVGWVNNGQLTMIRELLDAGADPDFSEARPGRRTFTAYARAVFWYNQHPDHEEFGRVIDLFDEARRDRA